MFENLGLSAKVAEAPAPKASASGQRGRALGLAVQVCSCADAEQPFWDLDSTHPGEPPLEGCSKAPFLAAL